MRISDWSSDVCSSDLARRWLLDARPDAVLHDVTVAGVRGGALTAHARIEGLGFAAQGDAPGISGLSGVLDGDAEGLSFKFDPQATLRFDWPSGFGTPHDGSEEHTSELQSLMRISYAVFCLKKKKETKQNNEDASRKVEKYDTI